MTPSGEDYGSSSFTPSQQLAAFLHTCAPAGTGAPVELDAAELVAARSDGADRVAAGPHALGGDGGPDPGFAARHAGRAASP